jgi:hypothetical protein
MWILERLWLAIQRTPGHEFSDLVNKEASMLEAQLTNIQCERAKEPKIEYKE